MLRSLCLAASLVTLVAAGTRAAGVEAFTDPAKAGPDYAIQGEYKGELKLDQDTTVGAQVIALGDGTFHGEFFIGGLPGDGWKRDDLQLGVDSKTEDGVIVFAGDNGTAKVADGKLNIFNAGGEQIGSLAKVERKSPTLGAKPPAGAKVLFDGTNADQWVGGKIVEGNLLLAGTRSKDDFQDFTFHIEFRTPFVPKARGQGRGNSGVYLQDRYECQVLDSFGLEGLDNECGGFYQIKKPAVNMCFPPLAWQTYDIDFTAARFDGEKKTKDARVSVKHNGVTIFDDFELPHLTPGGAPTEYPGKGPFRAAGARQPGDVPEHLGGREKISKFPTPWWRAYRQVFHSARSSCPPRKALLFAAVFFDFSRQVAQFAIWPSGVIFFLPPA